MPRIRSFIMIVLVTIVWYQSTAFGQTVPAATAPIPAEQLERWMGFGQYLDRLSVYEAENRRRDAAAARARLEDHSWYRSRQRLRLADGTADAERASEDGNEQVHGAILQLKVLESELLDKFGTNHPRVISVRRRIDVLSEFLKRNDRENKRNGKHESVVETVHERPNESAGNPRAAERRRDSMEHREKSHPWERLIGDFLDAEKERRHHDQRKRKHERDMRGHGGDDRHHEEKKDGIRVQMERVHALYDAAERLEQGGVHDVAHEMHRRAEELEREIDRHREDAHKPDRIVHELMAGMHELRREVRELHEKLDMILEFIEEERDEEED